MNRALCYSFQSGSCSYGDRCRFSHEVLNKKPKLTATPLSKTTQSSSSSLKASPTIWKKNYSSGQSTNPISHAKVLRAELIIQQAQENGFSMEDEEEEDEY